MNVNFTGMPVISNSVAPLADRGHAGPLGSWLPVPLGSHPGRCFPHRVATEWQPTMGFPRLWTGRIEAVILQLKAEGGEETGIRRGLWPDFPWWKGSGPSLQGNYAIHCEPVGYLENWDSSVSFWVFMISLLCLSPSTPFFIFLHSLNQTFIDNSAISKCYPVRASVVARIGRFPCG